MSMNHKLSDYNSLQELKYYLTYEVYENNTLTLKPIPIADTNIIETQIVWDMFSPFAHGTCFIKDETNILSNLFLHYSLKFRIEAKDRFDIEFNNSFVITNISTEAFDSSKNMIRIDFVDTWYNYMSNLYISKGYNNVGFDGILKDVMSFDINNNDDNFKKVYTTKSPVIHKNVVIPANRPFINFLLNKEMQDGIFYAYCRNRIILSDTNNLNNNTIIPNFISTYFPVEKRIVFTDQKSDNKLLPYQIKSAKRLYFDATETNAVIPKIAEFIFDYSTKSINPTKTDNVYFKDLNYFNNFHSDNSYTYMDGALLTTGYKYKETYNKFHNDRYYTYKMLHNSMYEISTDGCFNLDIATIVGFRPFSKNENTMLGDTLASGQYFITKIVDKIQGNNFNQIVTLGRSGYMLAAKPDNKESSQIKNTQSIRRGIG